MPAYYVISEWIQTEGEEGLENTPRLFLEHPAVAPLYWVDVTSQAGPEIKSGHLGVFTLREGHKQAEFPKSLLDALEADPNYRIIQVGGKPSREEIDDLKGVGLKEPVERAESKHGPEMTREHLKDALVEQFRQQGKRT